MIVFDKLWETMESRGMPTYQLREKCGIDSKTVRRLRANENIETKTLDKLCVALSCRLEDIAEYIVEGPRYSFVFVFTNVTDSLRYRSPRVRHRTNPIHRSR